MGFDGKGQWGLAVAMERADSSWVGGTCRLHTHGAASGRTQSTNPTGVCARGMAKAGTEIYVGKGRGVRRDLERDCGAGGNGRGPWGRRRSALGGLSALS